MIPTHESITLGRPSWTVELGGLRLIEAVYPPGQVFAPHAHGSANITLVLAGGFREHSPHARALARPTSLVVKPRGTVHADGYGNRPTRSFVIEVAPEREAEVGLARFQRERWFHGGACVGAVLEVLRAARAREGDLERTALACVGAIVRRSGNEPAPAPPSGARARLALGAAEGLLRASLARPPSSPELGARVGLHPVYLARLFRAAHGCGIAAFRRRLQTQEAARRLAETKDPLGQVALATGFADQSHLCRAFKAEFGLSPGSYRGLVASVQDGGSRGSMLAAWS